MPKPLDLSPSVGHRPLLKAAPMQLAYSGQPFKPWQAKVRRKLRELLGVPASGSLSLQPRTIWTKQHELGTIEKIVFRSEPGVDVPAYWCVPHGREKPFETWICLQGHSTGMHLSIAVDRETESQPVDVAGDRDMGLECMRRGRAALCIEQRSFGERRELVQEKRSQHSGCHDAAMRSMLLGRTLLGERVFDVERALEYLKQRGDADMKRIGILGQSGGGSVSMLAGALLPQIAYCMPCCSTARVADSIAVISHCICNTIPGVMQWMDQGEILGAIAPRPLVIINGKQDTIFPIDSARAVFRKAREIYSAAGAKDRILFVEAPGGHDFYAELGWTAMRKLQSRN